ncbi:ATP synthase F1 subunit delta [Granulicella aggregans]|jgi:F-type H+-transporting ATPase subunit delta|uniref:ATP synthase F1 subunit delta n=1 Tax=Granulicella aggregans TaxID=474949 RepID=UPI0021E075C3|nr:ATP synthase F1 subunit delta [Granulicella aggregans]
MAVITLRYAHAFEQVVVSSKLDPAAALSQLRDFSATYAGSADLREILMDPSVPKEQKLKVLDAIGGKIGMYPQVRNFVAVITEHERLHELDEIINEYAEAADADAGVSDAEITTALPLNDDDRNQLEAEVGKLAGGRIRAVYLQDSTLLGGVIVKLGSTVYDGSVRGQLEQMKQRLINA